MGFARARVGRAAGVALVVLWMLATGPAGVRAQHRAPGLRGLTHVALAVSLPPELKDVERDLAARVERLLGERPVELALDPGSASTLRVVATVRAESATRLRGFWLPFSGTYAIGAVRLEVERPVLVPGAASAAAPPVPGVVWQRDRHIAGPWRHAAAEIGAAVEELTRALREECRRARDR